MCCHQIATLGGNVRVDRKAIGDKAMRYFVVMMAAFVSACGGDNALLDLPAPDYASISARPELPSDVQFETLLNNVRFANGAADVAYDARLGGAAQAHAEDMLQRNYFDHITPEGLKVGDRATALGYGWSMIGENIAQGQTSQAQVMAAWTGSAGHHANNINPGFQDFGLGMAGSGSSTRWVLVLGRE